MIVTFNWYFLRKSNNVWVPPTGHNILVPQYAVQYTPGDDYNPAQTDRYYIGSISQWVQDTPGYTRSDFTVDKLTILADNFTNQGIVGGSWFIHVKNMFIVDGGSASATSPTCYMDCLKVSKYHPLHYRDQSFQLYFNVTSNFITDLTTQDYFQVVDPAMLHYYYQLVDRYYPPLGTGKSPLDAATTTLTDNNLPG